MHEILYQDRTSAKLTDPYVVVDRIPRVVAEFEVPEGTCKAYVRFSMRLIVLGILKISKRGIRNYLILLRFKERFDPAISYFAVFPQVLNMMGYLYYFLLNSEKIGQCSKPDV